MAGRQPVKDMYFFEYIPERTLLKKAPAIIKLPALLGLCLIAATAPVRILPYSAVFLVPLFFAGGRASVIQILGMWPVHIFIVFSGIIKATGSDAAAAGAALSGRMFIMLCGSVLFYSSTSTAELRRALEKLLSPLPWSSGKRVADLVSMTMGFLPLIFKTADELKAAETARSFRRRRNFFKTVKVASIPLIIELLIKAEEMTDAYYSRCYSSDQHH